MTKLTLDELRQTDAYQNLSTKQQKMVEVFLETGSKIQAMKEVCSVGSKAGSHRSMSYASFGKIGVRECLAVAAGVDPQVARSAALRAQFEDDLDRCIASKKSTRTQLAALKLKAQLNGYILPEVPASASEFKVGQRVTQRDDKGVLHTGIVKEISDEGVPTKIEEIA